MPRRAQTALGVPTEGCHPTIHRRSRSYLDTIHRRVCSAERSSHRNSASRNGMFRNVLEHGTSLPKLSRLGAHGRRGAIRHTRATHIHQWACQSSVAITAPDAGVADHALAIAATTLSPAFAPMNRWSSSSAPTGGRARKAPQCAHRASHARDPWRARRPDLRREPAAGHAASWPDLGGKFRPSPPPSSPPSPPPGFDRVRSVEGKFRAPAVVGRLPIGHYIISPLRLAITGSAESVAPRKCLHIAQI